MDEEVYDLDGRSDKKKEYSWMYEYICLYTAQMRYVKNFWSFVWLTLLQLRLLDIPE